MLDVAGFLNVFFDVDAVVAEGGDGAVGFDGPGDYFMAAGGALTRNVNKHSGAYVYCGVMLCHPRLFAGAPSGPFSTVELWDRAERAGKLFGLVHPARWFHIGTPDALTATGKILAQG